VLKLGANDIAFMVRIYCHGKGIELQEEEKLTLNLGISEDEFIRTDDNLDYEEIIA